MSEQLQLPTASYAVGGYGFGERLRRRFGVPAIHLGEDVVLGPGTAVHAIGAGNVVLAKTLPGSESKKTWGGVVVIKHLTSPTTSFFSVYGHLKDLQVTEGDTVSIGQQVASIAPALTAENGWWQKAHLHFAIYTGPWSGEILPGWWRPEHFWRTKLSWWHAPQKFIEESAGAE